MQVHMYLMWSRTYVVALLDGAHAELTHLSLAESTMCVQIIVGRTIAIVIRTANRIDLPLDDGPSIFRTRLLCRALGDVGPLTCGPGFPQAHMSVVERPAVER